MKKKIKCGIIGLGKIGLDYDLNKKNQIKTHSKSLFTNKNFSIVGGVDKNFTRRAIFQKEYNLNSYSSINKMFKFNKPEFIVISTPTETHKKVFDEITKYNSVKLILFEKPISYNLNDLKKIYFISKKKRIKIFINYIRRSNKDFQRLRKKFQI